MEVRAIPDRDCTCTCRVVLEGDTPPTKRL
jgi:hypothetical protein